MLYIRQYPRNSALSLLVDEILLLCGNCCALNSYPPCRFNVPPKGMVLLKVVLFYPYNVAL